MYLTEPYIPCYFNKWVEKILIKDLKNGQVILMGNVAFYKSQTIIDLTEYFGRRVIFLPSDSTDLNPIEKLWTNMKRWPRNNIAKWFFLLFFE